MTRKLLIIANPGESDAENYCEGVNIDVTRYRDFFTSSIGGAWKLQEIEILNRPLPRAVDQSLRSLCNVDYSMVIFCGHGYSCENGTTMVELREGFDYDSTKFHRGAARHTVILDCCRVVYEPVLEHAQNRFDLYKSAESLAAKAKSRQYYDASITQCPPGLVVLYACAIGETAGDDSSTGGVYSHALRSSAIEWSNAQSGLGILSVSMAHNRATERVCYLTDGRQNPKITKPRTAPYFPFAVSL